MLTGKVAMVAGAGGGLGARIAEALAEAGATVVLADLDRADVADHLANQIRALGGRALALQGDMTDPAQVDRVLDQAADAAGVPDVAVNCINRPFRTLPVAQMAWPDLAGRVLAELQGAFHLTQRLAAVMATRGGGRLIHVSSGLARYPRAGYAALGVAKAALEGFVRYCAQEFGPRGITVNAVAPGMVEAETLRWIPADIVAHVRAATPLMRLATPDDVAGAILFLASPWGQFITGAVIPVNGGFHMA